MIAYCPLLDTQSLRCDGRTLVRQAKKNFVYIYIVRYKVLKTNSYEVQYAKAEN